MYNIYCDGSAAPNPGHGGFGVVVLEDDKTLFGVYREETEQTTNNREELKALIFALKTAHRLENAVIYTDSAYCCNIYNSWMHSWAANGWKRNKGEIENLDLVKQIYDLYCEDFVTPIVNHIKGHDGLIGNELADAVATNNMVKFNKVILKLS